MEKLNRIRPKSILCAYSIQSHLIVRVNDLSDPVITVTPLNDLAMNRAPS